MSAGIDRVRREHPKYSVMVTEAIATLNDKKGSSKIAIEKFICANYKVGLNYDAPLKRALLASLEDGVLIKPKGVGLTGSFKLGHVGKPKVVKKTAAKKIVKNAPEKKASPVKKVVKKIPKKGS